jgi:hypothetical protein
LDLKELSPPDPSDCVSLAEWAIEFRESKIAEREYYNLFDLLSEDELCCHILAEGLEHFGDRFEGYQRQNGVLEASYYASVSILEFMLKRLESKPEKNCNIFRPVLRNISSNKKLTEWNKEDKARFLERVEKLERLE